MTHTYIMYSHSLLRQYLREVLESRKASKKLRVFDFDDTLVRTRSMIHVTSANGERYDLTPAEYAIYAKQPGDSFDYSDFSGLIDPQQIKWTFDILRRIVAKGGETVILTARAEPEPIRKFLADTGLPSLEVVALGDSNPTRKSDYIAKRIEEDGFTRVEFFDDSYKNVAAVKSLQPNYPGVKIISRHVVHKTGIS